MPIATATPTATVANTLPIVEKLVRPRTMGLPPWKRLSAQGLASLISEWVMQIHNQAADALRSALRARPLGSCCLILDRRE